MEHHPLALWFDSKGLTYADAAALATARGVRISTSYLAQIAGGFYPCSRKLAKRLSLHLTKGDVTADAILDFEYRGRKPTTKRAA